MCECDPCFGGETCQSICSERGECVEDSEGNKFCDCGTEGYRGERCEIQGCPGIKVDCSGNGTCLPDEWTCLCNSGFTGRGCNELDCLKNCSNNGVCTYEMDSGLVFCDCHEGYFDQACDYQCYNGTVNEETDVCDCDPCYSGYECDLECSNRGSCDEEACVCQVGYKGDYCETEGCYLDCSGRGSCVNKVCVCSTGWIGDGCEIGKCVDDCNNRGECISEDGSSAPQCKNCQTGWLGESCETPCYGVQEPMNSGICKCNNSCTHGDTCDQVCSGNGQCINDTCLCYDPETKLNPGFYGDFCEQELCPGNENILCNDHGFCQKDVKGCSCDNGWYGDGCENVDCPGTPDCNENGVCDTATSPPSCICNDNWMGPTCDIPCLEGDVLIDAETGDEYCSCYDCYSGANCDLMCNSHGTCVNDTENEGRKTCDCDVGWWEDFCKVKGCPGDEVDCSNHGTCDISSQECTCNDGYAGDGCNELNCPGTPDCNAKGECIEHEVNGVTCINCNLSMGLECEEDCIHGYAEDWSYNCICNPCYSGKWNYGMCFKVMQGLFFLVQANTILEQDIRISLTVKQFFKNLFIFPKSCL